MEFNFSSYDLLKKDRIPKKILHIIKIYIIIYMRIVAEVFGRCLGEVDLGLLLFLYKRIFTFVNKLK